MDYKSVVAKLIKSDELDKSEILAALAPTQDAKNGDLCLPCFKFAAKLHMAPPAIANKLKEDLLPDPLIEKTEVAGGYLNFYFNREIIAKNAIDAIANNNFTLPPLESNGKTVCIDYSSINIAKPFHIGHLLTTAIGGSLYRMYKYCGYNAVGINHLGDWGTQFGKLIVAYKKWGDDGDIEKRNIRALLDLYVRFHTEAEKNPELEDEGRYWFKQIEDGNEEALAIFHKFKDITLKEVSKVYDRLGITFDSYAGESFYNDKMQPIIDRLKEKGLLTISEGASVVDLEKYGMPPCLILKKDGTSLYATRDLAAAVYRKKTYDFYKCLYVVAYQQNLHFKQFFKVLELMGYDWAKDCVHVPFGMVSLEGAGSLSTRKGNVVFLSDVLDSAVSKSLEIINEKNPDLENKEQTAQDVGVGAVVFGALSGGRIKDISFSLDKALSFDGETGPYLQYTHARCCSIAEKAKGVTGKLDYSVLCDEDAFAVVKLLDAFYPTVLNALDKYEPSMVSRYLIDLAQAFNKFYVGSRILGEADDVAYTRLTLVKAVEATLKTGLNLILLNAPEKM
ncbi:MAG: arginine--tRNA ligase [Firmicutes bacterium]|nr:arginine--tRNA ligase [Bacillota bacterium]MDY5530646.1 arginine--tRNA ligase [Pumilibacteraceae bacterium]